MRQSLPLPEIGKENSGQFHKKINCSSSRKGERVQSVSTGVYESSATQCVCATIEWRRRRRLQHTPVPDHHLGVRQSVLGRNSSTPISPRRLPYTYTLRPFHSVENSQRIGARVVVARERDNTRPNRFSEFRTHNTHTHTE